jgi:hypothetical protein
MCNKKEVDLTIAVGGRWRQIAVQMCAAGWSHLLAVIHYGSPPGRVSIGLAISAGSHAITGEFVLPTYFTIT